MNKNINLGIVGATGVVGSTFLDLMRERQFQVQNLKLFASDQSAGKKIKFNNKEITVESLKPGCFEGLQVVFFSSGDDISKEWAPLAVKSGAFAIDNSAAFRMDEDIALIVPEVNGQLLEKMKRPQIIANPNCSTIQLVVLLKALKDSFNLKSVKVSSYQAVSGAGAPAITELLSQNRKLQYLCDLETPYDVVKSFSQIHLKTQPQYLPKEIAYNCVPQIGGWTDGGATSEERKIRLETKKILSLPQLPVSAFTVRVPAINAHCETVWVEFDKVISRESILNSLENAKGLVVYKDEKQYALASDVSGKDPVFVGRIHQDADQPETWMFWVVSDNLKKGAALNGIQIAESLPI